jgi:hypothetical protein
LAARPAARTRKAFSKLARARQIHAAKKTAAQKNALRPPRKQKTQSTAEKSPADKKNAAQKINGGAFFAAPRL